MPDRQFTEASQAIEKLLNIMKRLRLECPWDAQQTHNSLKQYLLEEAYEVLETIDYEEWQKFKEELGDLLLQIVFHCEIASQNNHFDFSDVVQSISKKLVERHPHVFADKKVHEAREVQENWEHSKMINEKRSSILSGIPRAAPALLQAQRIQEKASTVGFDWGELAPVIDKVEEEWLEFKEAVKLKNPAEIENEFGDFLFSIVNLSRFLQITAEDALRRTNNKFIKRFRYIEKQYEQDPKAMKKASLQELDEHWVAAKRLDD